MYDPLLVLAFWACLIILLVLAPLCWIWGFTLVLWKGRGVTVAHRAARQRGIRDCKTAIVISWIWFFLGISLSVITELGGLLMVVTIFNSIFALLAMLVILGCHTDQYEAAAAHHCGACGFDLRGLPDDAPVCPECGDTIPAS